jgi:hypothetical protein
MKHQHTTGNFSFTHTDLVCMMDVIWGKDCQTLKWIWRNFFLLVVMTQNVVVVHFISFSLLENYHPKEINWLESINAWIWKQSFVRHAWLMKIEIIVQTYGSHVQGNAVHEMKWNVPVFR